VAREARLSVTVESEVPEHLPTGKATALFLYGTCRHPEGPIRRLELIVDGDPQPVLAHGMPRPRTRAPHGGFWTVASIPARGRAGAVSLELRAFRSGGGSDTAPLGQIEIREAAPPPALPAIRAGERPTIAVCMATFDPDPELFRRQVASLRAQSEVSWICLISDDCSRPERFDAIEAEIGGDERFVISRSERRLGFYRNFERALEMVPADAELIALCDQDDRWYPEKLETLRRELGDAPLAFSDARLVDAAGNVLAETIWEGWRSNRDNLASQLITNTITGAACLFRRHVLEVALPFPDAPGWLFHDHWLGCVALASGDIAYVDRPLYDYVQHGGAVLRGLIGGPDEQNAESDRPGALSRARLRAAVVRWRTRYFHGYIPLRLYAQTILSRCGPELDAGRRRALRTLIAADGSVTWLARLWARRLRRLLGRGETMGAEGVLATGILWRGLMVACSKSRRQPVALCDATMPPLAPRALEPRRWRRRQSRRAARLIAQRSTPAGTE
jgi:glycosyltransferase involved in cell wall biosynthesis